MCGELFRCRASTGPPRQVLHAAADCRGLLGPYPHPAVVAGAARRLRRLIRSLPRPFTAPQVNNTNETVGTFAIAYAAHKALSPVRFPPTVALTPVVARWLGKEPAAAASSDSGEQGGSSGGE